VGTLTRTHVLAGVVALLVGLPASGPAVAGKKGNADVYRPPYKKGPSGGDSFNYIHADPKSGEMAVLRMFPGFPPVVGCFPEPSAGWATFRVPHEATKPISRVVLSYDGGLDPYAWITLGVRKANGKWLGIKKVQGPHAGAGKVRLRLFDQPTAGETVDIEFGLQLGDACPQVGGGIAEFASIKVEAK
jgi:hypothetical protein